MDAGLWAALAPSDEARKRLTQFGDMVTRWTARINLIAPSTVPNLWERHIEDSARLLLYAPARPHHWVDLGSGGGFPGIVIAILLAGSGAQVTLVESDQRKAALLQQALHGLSVPGRVLAQRIESLEPLNADVLSARALAPLERLCDYAAPHLAPQAVALFPKGARWRDELATARVAWAFDLDVHGDHGHKAGVVLAVRNLRRGGDDRNG